MSWRFLFLVFLFWLTSCSLYSQVEEKQLVPSIRELIFPAQPETKNSFNLFYEIHLNRDSIPQPSFWYKIIFSKDSHFEFTLFPLFEDDHYEFYLYKVAGNTLFCEAIAEDRVTSLNHYKYQKAYQEKDSDQSASFRASLVHVKPIPVKAGDAIYLEVLAVKGRDCGHVFDCRTSEGSLVTKVINDNCDSITPINVNTSLVLKERREAVALRYLSDLFCIERKESIPFTAINLLGETKTVKQQNNFLEYSQEETINYKQYKNITVDTVVPKLALKKEAVTPSVSVSDQVLKERSRIADSMRLIQKSSVKSTAELNQLSKEDKHHTVYDVNGSKKATRLQVDKALFSFLLTDLQAKRTLKREEVKQSYTQYKKVNPRDARKRRIASKKLKRLKTEKKAIEAKITITQSKIKNIERLISKEEYTLQEAFVFDKSTSVESEEVIYKIQIGVYKNKISPEIFNGLSPVSEDPYDGGVRYSVGAFPKFSYAKQAKEHVVEVGLKDAFIVAYFRNKRISIQDALKLER